MESYYFIMKLRAIKTVISAYYVPSTALSTLQTLCLRYYCLFSKKTNVISPLPE